MKIAISDDNDYTLDEIYQLTNTILCNEKNILVHKLSPQELLDIIASENIDYDLFILDIELGEFNGIPFAKKIKQINPNCEIIFISNYINYATDVYDVDHIYFITKDKIESHLERAIQKALVRYKTNNENTIIVTWQNNRYIIKISQILYIEALGRYLYYHTVSETIQCIDTLARVSNILPSSFVRCHKSYIINMNYMVRFERTECILSSDKHIPIGYVYSSNFREAFLEFSSSLINL